jgi:hypothetical protein
LLTFGVPPSFTFVVAMSKGRQALAIEGLVRPGF